MQEGVLAVLQLQQSVVRRIPITTKGRILSTGFLKLQILRGAYTQLIQYYKNNKTFLVIRNMT